MSCQDNFQVFIRIRPLSSRQSTQISHFQTYYLKKTTASTPSKATRLSQSAYNFASKFYNCDVNSLIKVEGDTIYVVDSEYKAIERKYRPHRYNGIFTEKVANAEVYETAVKGQVEKLLAGYNSTVFTYGITGSGKTYTVFGGCGRQEDKGVCYLSYQYLLSRKEEIEKVANCKVSLYFSFFEIYNENVRDLLSTQPVSQARPLTIIQDPKGNTLVQQLTQKPINSLQDIVQLLSQGCSKRALASTNSNLYSSRSHALQQLTVQICSNGELKSTAKMFIIDLAGSEKMQPVSTPKGIVEGANINKSLLALGNCINILSQRRSGTATPGGPGTTQHIPYRDSKLTRILKDSLGGNTSTLMIACISTNPFTIDETLTTLNYASRANGIQRKIVRNSVPQSQPTDDPYLRRQLESIKGMLSKPFHCSHCGHYETSLEPLLDSLTLNNLEDANMRISETRQKLQKPQKPLQSQPAFPSRFQTPSDCITPLLTSRKPQAYCSMVSDICQDIVRITCQKQQILAHMSGASQSLAQKLNQALKVNEQQMEEYKDILVTQMAKMRNREEELLKQIERLTIQNRFLMASNQYNQDQENQSRSQSQSAQKPEKRRLSNKLERVRVPSGDYRIPLANLSGGGPPR